MKFLVLGSLIATFGVPAFASYANQVDIYYCGLFKYNGVPLAGATAPRIVEFTSPKTGNKAYYVETRPLARRVTVPDYEKLTLVVRNTSLVKYRSESFRVTEYLHSQSAVITKKSNGAQAQCNSAVAQVK